MWCGWEWLVKDGCGLVKEGRVSMVMFGKEEGVLF